MPDPELFDIFLAKAVRFWIKTIEVHNIKDEKHCDTILDYLQSQLNAIHSQNPYDKIQSQSEIDFVLAAGIRFWYDVVKKKDIQNINHCNVVLNYFEGFLDDLDFKDVKNFENLSGDDEDLDDKRLVEVLAKPIVKFDEKVDEDQSDIEYNDDDHDDNYKMPRYDDHLDDFIDDYDDDDEEEIYKKKKKVKLESKVKVKKKRKRIKDSGDIDSNSANFDVIQRSFELISNFKDHVKKGGVVKCDYCEEQFSFVSHLSQHVSSDHEEKWEEFEKKYKIFGCTVLTCDESFYTKKAFSNHLRKVHNIKNVRNNKTIKSNIQKERVCLECDKVFTKKQTYLDHLKFHELGFESKPYRCDICDTGFIHLNSLQGHNIKFHKNTSSLCPNCGISFNNFMEMRQHKKKCKKLLDRQFNPLKKEKIKPKPESLTEHCPQCNEIVKKNSLKYHLYKYHNEGGLCCDTCGKRVFNSQELSTHQNIHIEEKTVPCAFCDKMFKSKFYLDRHIKTVHTSNEDKPFHCTQCGKGFVNKQNLEGHMNMHLGLKPYKCNHCEAGFQNASNKRAHMKKVHNLGNTE